MWVTNRASQSRASKVFRDLEVSFERLASLDPDVLIVHGEKNEKMKKIAAFRKDSEFGKLKAVKNSRVLVFSCDTICHANASIADTVEMIARDL